MDKTEDEIQKLKDYKSWTEHTEYKEDPAPDLPIPRLELEWVRRENVYDGYEWLCRYSLVYRHLLGHIEFVPLGLTKRSSGREPGIHQDNDLPIRDGYHIKHDAAQLLLPAYVRYKKEYRRLEIEYLTESL